MKIKKIESHSNPIYKKLLSLTKNKGVEEHGLCLVSGDKVTSELATHRPQEAFWIYHQAKHAVLATHPLAQLILLSKKHFDALDVVGTDSPILCLPVIPTEPWNSDSPLRANELLCALGDPKNLGSLLRSALAFGIKNVVLLEECCNPFHPKAVKASSGACFHLQYYKGPAIYDLHKVKEVLALDGKGHPLAELDRSRPYRLLLGEEGQGIPDNIDARRVAIAMEPGVESLNATVAASIVLYELNK